VLLESDVLDAMPAFAPPGAGVTMLPTSCASIETLIAAN
jgi:hypothetical protein